MKFKIYKYEKLNSTNDEAMRFIKDKNIDYGYIHSNIQTSGRGTQGKKWISIEGNLFGSIFFPLKKNYPSFHEFSFINPIIIYDVIKSFCNKNDLALKWPNDILVQKKKICGILQEVIEKNNLKYLIIGIGISLIKSPILQDTEATNILKETNTNIRKDEIIKKIIKSYENFFSKVDNYDFSEYKNKVNLFSVKPRDLAWN